MFLILLISTYKCKFDVAYFDIEFIMRKISLIIFFWIISYYNIIAQNLGWTWVHGSSSSLPSGIQGLPGVFAPNNTPQGLTDVASWTDLQGNFWIFGGYTGIGISAGFNNELWKYNPIINQWAYIKGSGIANHPGTFGILGVPSTTNIPPSIAFGAATWTDNLGDLYLYGGTTAGIGAYSCLWRYNISSNIWTWLNGASTVNAIPIYGTLGVASTATQPGARQETLGKWVDNNNNLYLFGGINISNDAYNSLWKYNISTNMWTWLKGANFVNATGVNGILGVPNIANVPSARMIYTIWEDNNGKFWFFGGYEKTSGSTGAKNDLWSYDPITNMFTWVGGSQIVNDNGTLGVACTCSSASYPAARTEGRAAWVDATGNFWMYGGFQNLSSVSNFKNDFWTYHPTTNIWRLISGSNVFNQPSNYGILNMFNTNNYPGQLAAMASFKDNTNNFYMFGGVNNSTSGGFNFLNALWKYTIDTSCFSPTVLNLGNDTALCSPFSILLNTGSNNTLWSTGATTSNINITSAGTYWARVITPCDTLFDTIHITQNPTPVFTLGNDTIICLGQTVNLTVNIPGSTVLWSNGTILNNYLVNTTSTIWAEVTLGSCKYRDTITVTVASVFPTIDLGNDTTLCNSSSLILVSPLSTTIWSTGITASSITVNSPGTYYCEYSTLCGGSKDTIVIYYESLPQINLPLDTTFCSNFSYTIFSSNPNTNWSTGAFGSTITINNFGVYYGEVTNICGTSIDSISIKEKKLPYFDLGFDQVLCSNSGYTLHVPAEYLNENYLWNDNTNDIEKTITQAGVYVLSITNECGTATDSIIFYNDVSCTIELPKAFSPNDDGLNDKYYALSNCDINNYCLSIFNRWGELVYKSYDQLNAWDGKFKNKNQDLGTFVYLLEYYDTCEKIKKLKKGNITLLK
jgi:gliding motility-associated-like protein